MDEPKEAPPNGMRKTTKAAITFSMLMLSIRPLRDLKEFILGEQIVTNARIETTMNEGFKRLEDKFAKHIDDDVVTHRRMRDLQIAETKDSEGRCEKHADKVETRVSNLELYAFKTFASKRATN